MRPSSRSFASGHAADTARPVCRSRSRARCTPVSSSAAVFIATLGTDACAARRPRLDATGADAARLRRTAGSWRRRRWRRRAGRKRRRRRPSARAAARSAARSRRGSRRSRSSRCQIRPSRSPSRSRPSRCPIVVAPLDHGACRLAQPHRRPRADDGGERQPWIRERRRHRGRAPARESAKARAQESGRDPAAAPAAASIVPAAASSRRSCCARSSPTTPKTPACDRLDGRSRPGNRRPAGRLGRRSEDRQGARRRT